MHLLPVVARWLSVGRWGSTLAFAGVLLAPLPALCGATAEVHLVLDGKEVTKAFPWAVVRFIPRPKIGKTEVPPDVVCSPRQVCDIPPGLYLLEVEDKALIVESRSKLVVNEGDAGAITIHLNVARAGVIEIPGGRIPLGGSLEALDERYGTMHARRVDGPVARVRVPGRRVILCAYDQDKAPLGCQSATARAGETKTLTGLPRLGRGRGQLLVGLDYQDESALADARVALRGAETVLPPDAVVTGRPGHLYAVWYDVPAGPAKLEVFSRFWYAKDGRVTVPERGAGVVTGIGLSRKPKLSVSLEGAERLGTGDVSVDVFTSCPADVVSLEWPPPLLYCRSAGTQSGPPGTSFEFNDLEPGLAAVRWRKEPLSNARWVDLREGESREERLPVELFEVHGTVRRGGRPLPVEMRWEMGNDVALFRTRTDEDGTYRVFVAQPGRWGVGLRDAEGRVSGEACVVTSDARCDFDVPANRVAVRVVDEADGPVAGAKVSFVVHGSAPEADPRDMGGVVTDTGGSATLPPLPSGSLALKVVAEGFAPGTAGPIDISEATTDDEVTVRLRKSAGIRISIFTPEGQPARQAKVWSGANGAEADQSGVAQFDSPLAPGSPLIAFDLRGEMAFTRFPGGESCEIRIPRSGPPIVVRVQRPDGGPVPDVVVHVAVDGVLDDMRFFDQIHSSGGQGVSDESGTMRITGIPGQGTLVVYPVGRPDLAQTRALPVLDEIAFTLPLGAL